MADILSVWGLAAVVAAYLIGSLSFAVIVSKFYGLDDPRSYGSGNPGATNVLRSGRKKAAALVLLRHRSNIQNLLSGKESKIGSGK